MAARNPAGPAVPPVLGTINVGLAVSAAQAPAPAAPGAQASDGNRWWYATLAALAGVAIVIGWSFHPVVTRVPVTPTVVAPVVVQPVVVTPAPVTVAPAAPAPGTAGDKINMLAGRPVMLADGRCRLTDGRIGFPSGGLCLVKTN